MEIGYHNKNIIDQEIYIHDSEFISLLYDYINKKVSINCKNYFTKTACVIDFRNVIFFEGRLYEPWGKGNCRILNWELDDNEIKLNELLKKQKINPQKYEYSKLTENKHFFTTNFIFDTGDIIQIVCESICYLEQSF